MPTSQQTQTSQAQKVGFDPNAMSFGGGFKAHKSFSSFGGQQSSNMFNQNISFGQQNQNSSTGLNNPQNTTLESNFGQSNNLFNNPNSVNSSQTSNFSQGNIFSNTSTGQGTSMFSNFNQNSPNIFTSRANQSAHTFQNSLAPQSNLEGGIAQSNSIYSPSNKTGNQGGNFLQNFVPKSTSPPVGVNPSLLAPRK